MKLAFIPIGRYRYIHLLAFHHFYVAHKRHINCLSFIVYLLERQRSIDKAHRHHTLKCWHKSSANILSLNIRNCEPWYIRYNNQPFLLNICSFAY